VLREGALLHNALKDARAGAYMRQRGLQPTCNVSVIVRQ
jgi:hypothetical protein